MNPNLIIRLPTDSLEKVEMFKRQMESGESVIIPDHVRLMYRDKDGFWHETGDVNLGADE